MGDQTQAYDIFQTPLSSGYPLPLRQNCHSKKHLYNCKRLFKAADHIHVGVRSIKMLSTCILLDFKVTKWAVSSLTHSSNPFQVNVFM